MEEKKNVLQAVDDEARHMAKRLIRTARFGALAHSDANTGLPHVSRVGVATSINGAPVILISQLSPHFAGLEKSPDCSVLLGEPGKGDPLAHPRITVMAKARKLTDGSERKTLRARYLRRHEKASLYVDFADFAFWVLEPQGASLNGGYGKAYTLEAEDCLSPLAEGLAQAEADAVDHMNDDHFTTLSLYAKQASASAGMGWKLASLDSEGMDLIRDERLLRVWYPKPLKDAGSLRGMVVAMAKQMRGQEGQDGEAG